MSCLGLRGEWRGERGVWESGVGEPRPWWCQCHELGRLGTLCWVVANVPVLGTKGTLVISVNLNKGKLISKK